jgi:hypothetical protein
MHILIQRRKHSPDAGVKIPQGQQETMQTSHRHFVAAPRSIGVGEGAIPDDGGHEPHGEADGVTRMHGYRMLVMMRSRHGITADSFEEPLRLVYSVAVVVPESPTPRATRRHTLDPQAPGIVQLRFCGYSTLSRWPAHP